MENDYFVFIVNFLFIAFAQEQS